MKPGELQHAGTHLIADLQGVDSEKLADAAVIEALLKQGAIAAGASIVYSHFHTFGPGQGITGVVLLAESHISIHTWPELGFAALDIFMCGAARPQHALDLICAALSPSLCETRQVQRGYSIVAA
jgi:S-adenosylmethionine decarboxylase